MSTLLHILNANKTYKLQFINTKGYRRKSKCPRKFLKNNSSLEFRNNNSLVA